MHNNYALYLKIGETMSSGTFKCASQKLRLLHQDGAKPFLIDNARFCAYSLLTDSQRPSCPFNHRAYHKVPMQYLGKTCYFILCWDGRAGNLEDFDYIVIESNPKQKVG